MRRRRGFTLISMLMSLVIIGILMGMYMQGGPGGKGAKPWPMQMKQRALDAAMAANINAMNTNYTMWRIDHGGQLNADALRQYSQTMPQDNQGGRYYVNDEKIYASSVTDTLKFHELLQKKL